MLNATELSLKNGYGGKTQNLTAALTKIRLVFLIEKQKTKNSSPRTAASFWFISRVQTKAVLTVFAYFLLAITTDSVFRGPHSAIFAEVLAS